MADSSELQEVIDDYESDYLVINEETLEKVVGFYAEKHYDSTVVQIETKENGELVAQLEPL